jgi:hypothetical protein
MTIMYQSNDLYYTQEKKCNGKKIAILATTLIERKKEITHKP